MQTLAIMQTLNVKHKCTKKDAMQTAQKKPGSIVISKHCSTILLFYMNKK